jgi:hypothetical protein
MQEFSKAIGHDQVFIWSNMGKRFLKSKNLAWLEAQAVLRLNKIDEYKVYKGRIRDKATNVIYATTAAAAAGSGINIDTVRIHANPNSKVKRKRFERID